MCVMNTLPRELVEMIVLDPGLDDRWGLVAQVCRLWRDIVDRAAKARMVRSNVVTESVPLLEWARLLGYSFFGWKHGAHAARAGRLDVLRWLYAHDYPLTTDIVKRPLDGVTWKFSSGPVASSVRGTGGRAFTRPRVATSGFCSGPAPTAARCA